MKLSVSLSAADVAVLDAYAEATRLPSRSAAVQQAIRLLREATLEQDYADAWADWEARGEADRWEATAPDGMIDAAR